MPRHSNKPDRASNLAGAATVYVLAPILITAPSAVIYLFTRDIEKAIVWPAMAVLMAVLGTIALGIIIFIISSLIVWTSDDMVTPMARLYQRRKNRVRAEKARA